MKKSEILRRAAKRIQTGKDTYLCFAIMSSGGPRWDCEYLRNEVTDLLGGSYTLSHWLHKEGHITDQEYRKLCDGYFRYRKKLQVTRVAWANRLADRYAARGL